MIYAVAQIDFSPIENMEAKIPAIQDILRNADYPNYEVQDIQNFSIYPGRVRVEGTRRWVFANKKQEGSIILTKGSIVFCVSDYDTFPIFLEHIIELTKSIDTTIEFHKGTIPRIALRYIDLLRGLDEVSAKDYLRKSFISSDSLSAADSKMLQFMTEVDLGNNSTARIILFSSKTMKEFPPQIVPIGLKTIPNQLDESMLILDTSYTHERVGDDYDLEEIRGDFIALHSTSSEMFKDKLVTKKALTTWKKKV